MGEKADEVTGVTVITLSRDDLTLDDADSYQAIHVRNGLEHLIAVLHFQEDATDVWNQLLYWTEPAGVGRTYEQITDAGKKATERLYKHCGMDSLWRRKGGLALKISGKTQKNSSKSIRARRGSYLLYAYRG
ncbi:hypothetical protein GCM10020331_088030 [Ectobacillus funiculus]